MIKSVDQNAVGSLIFVTYRSSGLSFFCKMLNLLDGCK